MLFLKFIYYYFCNFKSFVFNQGKFFNFNFLYFLIFAFSCTHTSHQPETRTVFRYNQHNPITSLDPAFARSQNNIWAVDCLFNGLVQLDDSLRVQPCIAKSWTVSSDGLEYRFLLRSDVFFHDSEVFPAGKGRVVVAADIVYSFSRLVDDSWPKPGSWIFKGRVADSLPFVAQNDSVFVLRLKGPFPPMLQILTMQYASIVPREATEFYGREFRRHPVGTGPFRFKIWAENHGLVLLKNPDYFEFDSAGNHLPYLDAVKVTFIADRKTAFLEFKKGNLDYLFGLESSYIHELLTPEGALRPELDGYFQFYKNPYLNTEYLGFRLDSLGLSALQQKAVRQALNYGFDREQMLRTLRNNVGKPASGGFIPLGMAAYDKNRPSGYHYDPARAAALLDRAGFPRGQGLPEIPLWCNSDYLDLCTFAARQWADLGIRVRLELADANLLRERMRQGTAPFFRASWIADYPDPESFLTCFYSANASPPNYTRFSNSEFDRLYERALKETHANSRMALYRQMDRFLIDDAPVVLLFYDQTSQFAQAGILGLPHNAMNLLNLKKVKKNSEKILF